MKLWYRSPPPGRGIMSQNVFSFLYFTFPLIWNFYSFSYWYTLFRPAMITFLSLATLPTRFFVWFFLSFILLCVSSSGPTTRRYICQPWHRRCEWLVALSYEVTCSFKFGCVFNEISRLCEIVIEILFDELNLSCACINLNLTFLKDNLVPFNFSFPPTSLGNFTYSPYGLEKRQK